MTREPGEGRSLASRRGADRPPAVWAAARSPRGHTGCHRDGTSAVRATVSESAVLGCSPRQLHSASFLDWKALHTRARDATVSPAACCNSRAGRCTGSAAVSRAGGYGRERRRRVLHGPGATFPCALLTSPLSGACCSRTPPAIDCA